MRSFAWILVGIAAGVGLSLVVRRASSHATGPDPVTAAAPLAAPGHAAPGNAAPGNAAGRGPAAVPAVEPAAQPPSADPFPRGVGPGGRAGAVLEAFYGNRWPLVRDELAQRIALDLAIEQPLPPWESVLDRLAATMRVSDARFAQWRTRWQPPIPVTIEYLAGQPIEHGVEIDTRDVEAVEARLVDARAETEADLRELRDVVDGVLRDKFRRGAYQHGPFVTIPSDAVPSHAFHADSTAIQGWAASWAVASREDPRIQPILEQLIARRGAMVGIVHAYLREIRR